MTNAHSEVRFDCSSFWECCSCLLLIYILTLDQWENKRCQFRSCMSFSTAWNSLRSIPHVSLVEYSSYRSCWILQISTILQSGISVHSQTRRLLDLVSLSLCSCFWHSLVLCVYWSADGEHSSGWKDLTVSLWKMKSWPNLHRLWWAFSVEKLLLKREFLRQKPLEDWT